VDTRRLIESVRIEVAERKRQGAYAPELLDRVGADFAEPAVDHATAPEALAYVPSARTLHAPGFFGPAVVAAKRVARRMLAWYVHPITEDQSRFNEAITTEVRRLEQRVRRLESGDTGSKERDAGVP
jgi:hypothetical protein